MCILHSHYIQIETKKFQISTLKTSIGFDVWRLRWSLARSLTRRWVWDTEHVPSNQLCWCRRRVSCGVCCGVVCVGCLWELDGRQHLSGAVTESDPVVLCLRVSDHVDGIAIL